MAQTQSDQRENLDWRSQNIYSDPSQQVKQVKKHHFLGYAFDAITQEKAIDGIEEWVNRGKVDGISRYVATVNLDFLTQSLGFSSGSPHHPELDRCIKESSMVLADGMPLIWWSKWFGDPLPERVTGSDLLPQIFQASAKKDWRIYLFGGTEATLDRNLAKIKNNYPDVQIVGMEAPMITTTGKKAVDSVKVDADMLHRIHDSQADLLILCLGCPKQELLFDRLRGQLQVPVTLGLGASLNFLSGDAKRAPKWMQKIGLEWIHRMLSDPKRLIARYTKDAFFFARTSLALASMQKRNALPHLAWSHRTFSKDGAYQNLINAPDICNDIPMDLWISMHESKSLIDLSKTTHISLRALSKLCSLFNEHHILVSKINPLLLKKLKRLNLDRIFNISAEKCESLLDGFSISSYDNGENLVLSPSGKAFGIRDMLLKLHLNFNENTKNVHVTLDACEDLDQKGFLDLMSCQSIFKKKGVNMTIGGCSKAEEASLKVMSWDGELKIQSIETQALRPIESKLMFLEGKVA
jgi:N-acetylglucosaminyldiphosphoundecaprenol N-acetyl-beta-D-mannosaminyltransferase